MSATEANRQLQIPQMPAGWPAAPLRLRVLPSVPPDLPLPQNALCVVAYGTAQLPDDPRCIRVPLTMLHGDHAGEIWESATAVRHGIQNGVRFAENDELLMVQLAVPETPGRDPETAAEQLYAQLLSFVAARGYPHLLRVWNYLERINQGAADAERYRQFCVGRYRALADRSDFEVRLPAASAIGSHGGGLHVHAFATRVAGLQVENPRQVSAFRYPRSYGARSPSFSRATLAPWDDGAQLFVSGTASIVGHATAHAGDVVAQLLQTHANLETLRAHAVASHLPGTDPQALVPELYTVYLRHADDLPDVLPTLAEYFGDAPCKVLAGDICRSELLIEVEASYRIAAPADRSGRRLSMRILDRGWRIAATGFSFAVFGIYALLLAVTVCPLIALFSRDPASRSHRVQWVVHRGCGQFVAMMKSLGLLTCELHGGEHLQDRRSRLIVANHPSLIDAVFLLSWLPQADCIVKQSLTVNPFLRWMVAWGGYIGNAGPDELVVCCAERLHAGRTLIVFPEGTRTVPGRTPVFRRGAARVALLADAEVLPVQIRCEPTTLTKGDKWWRVPERPPHYTFVVGEPFRASRFQRPGEAQAAAARRLTRHLETLLVPAAPRAQAEVAALSLT